MNIKKINKYVNLITAYLQAKKLRTTPFVRIIPTDKCNLNCAYCWQHSNECHDITEDECKLIIEKARKMKVGIVTFLGGEPLLWKHIYFAIELCNKYNIITDITTNGTLLNKDVLNKLANSGLDYLNISIDGTSTDKNLKLLESNISYLKEISKNYGVMIRINAVLYKNNFEEIKILIEYAHLHKIPISIGYIVPPINNTELSLKSIHFELSDTELLMEIIKYIKKKISEGYPIIDPIEYFENVYKYLRRERFWKCNYSGPYGWINVIGGCKIRSCTKKMDEMEYNFLQLKPKDIKNIKNDFQEMTNICNKECYSNCAYDSYYYMKNVPNLLKKLINVL